jgi:hypothetical protein
LTSTVPCSHLFYVPTPFCVLNSVPTPSCVLNFAVRLPSRLGFVPTPFCVLNSVPTPSCVLNFGMHSRLYAPPGFISWSGVSALTHTFTYIYGRNLLPMVFLSNAPLHVDQRKQNCLSRASFPCFPHAEFPVTTTKCSTFKASLKSFSALKTN